MATIISDVIDRYMIQEIFRETYNYLLYEDYPKGDSTKEIISIKYKTGLCGWAKNILRIDTEMFHFVVFQILVKKDPGLIKLEDSTLNRVKTSCHFEASRLYEVWRHECNGYLAEEDDIDSIRKERIIMFRCPIKLGDGRKKRDVVGEMMLRILLYDEPEYYPNCFAYDAIKKGLIYLGALKVGESAYYDLAERAYNKLWDASFHNREQRGYHNGGVDPKTLMDIIKEVAYEN